MNRKKQNNQKVLKSLIYDPQGQVHLILFIYFNFLNPHMDVSPVVSQHKFCSISLVQTNRRKPLLSRSLTSSITFNVYLTERPISSSALLPIGVVEYLSELSNFYTLKSIA